MKGNKGTLPPVAVHVVYARFARRLAPVPPRHAVSRTRERGDHSGDDSSVGSLAWGGTTGPRAPTAVPTCRAPRP